MCELTNKNELINELRLNHKIVIDEMVIYNNELKKALQLLKENKIDNISYKEYIINEQNTLYIILGSTSALIYIYNEIEEYELSAELYDEMKKLFLMLYSELQPTTNNEENFVDLINKMFETYTIIL